MSTNSKMLFTIQKLKKQIMMLEPLRYQQEIILDTFFVMEDEVKEIHPKVPKDGQWKNEKLGYAWQGYDKYLWIKFDGISLKSFDKTKKILGYFDFGKHVGDGNNEGFESLLYIDDAPYQAIDANHQEVFLPNEMYEGDHHELIFRLWSGLTGGHGVFDVEHVIKKAKLCYLDETIDDLYFLSIALWETIETLQLHDENHDQIHRLMKDLDEAFLNIDWSLKDLESDAFYQSIYQAHQVLIERKKTYQKHSEVNIHAIGHTHLDVAWLWRLKHTREKAIRSFSTVLRLMEQFPEYQFMHTTAQVYHMIEKDDPKLFKAIQEKVKMGTWEVEGSMWVEADCNLTSGESLVRQILYGKKYFKDKFNVDTKVLWLPDVFGYSWAIPQILKLSDIDTFMTTKISWNEYNQIPHDTFLWKGMDGSEILTYFITTPWKYQPKENFYSGYNAILAPYTIHGAWKKYQDKDLNQDILVSYGFGDGGGGVTRDMLEMRRRMDEIPGLPHIKSTSIHAFFNALHKKVESNKRLLAKWDGELYFEYHRGTYTTQSQTKKFNRALELMLKKAEFLDILACLSPIEMKMSHRYIDTWHTLLTNQFHDIIPGSSITEVYEDAMIDYKEAEKKIILLQEETSKKLLKSDDAYHVFSPYTHETDALIYVDSHETASFYRNDEKLLAQQTKDGYVIFVPNLKPLAITHFKTLKQVEKSTDVSLFNQKDMILDTPFYHVEFDQDGSIKTLYDQEQKRYVSTSSPMNQLQVFEDLPLTYDAWNLDIFYQEKMKVINHITSFEVIESGTLRHVIRRVMTYQKSKIVQDIIFYAHTKRIDFENQVDWYTQKQVLKVAFPVDIRTTKATYDVQFGNVERPTHWNTSWDLARFEVVGHYWADLSEGNYGVSLLNDSKYGYDIKENVMRLTLLRGTEYPDPFADQGHHAFTYALYPHLGSWQEGQTHQASLSINEKLHLKKGELKSDLQSLFNLSSDALLVDAIKFSEDLDAVILRCHEYKGHREHISITSDFEIESFEEVNLIERLIGERVYKNKIEVEIKPYEIKTFKVYFKKGR